jgi:hypothetical protein
MGSESGGGKMKKQVNPKYYEVLFDYVFGKGDPSIADIANGGAYADMAKHTLKGISDVDDRVKKEWRKNVTEYIEREIYSTLLSEKVGDSFDFDAYHSKACNEICAVSRNCLKDEVDFTYGQAQKWFNMTWKNVLVSGLWSDKFDEVLIEKLHAPVDSFIILAAKDINKYSNPSKSIDIPPLPWSQWDKDGYIEFQKGLRDILDVPKTSPLEWEMEVWALYRNNPAQRSEEEKKKALAYKHISRKYWSIQQEQEE